MRIQRFVPFYFSYTLPKPLRLSYYGGERTVLKRDAMLVRSRPTWASWVTVRGTEIRKLRRPSSRSSDRF